MRFCLFFVIASIAAFAADDPYAAELFQKHCASCHNSEAGAGGRVPQISALKSMTPAAIQKTLESGVMKPQAAPLSPGRTPENRKLSGNSGNPGTQARRNRESVSGGRGAWRKCCLGQLGRRSRQYQVPIGERRGAQRRRPAPAETEMGIRIPGHVHHAFAARRLSGQSIRGRAGRHGLRSRYEDRLRVLVHHCAVPGAIGHHGWRGRRQSSAVLRRFRRVRLRAGRNVREAVVEGARRPASGIHGDRDAGVLQGSPVCRVRLSRRISVGFSRLSVLHVPRQRVGSGCRHGKSFVEDLHHRRSCQGAAEDPATAPQPGGLRASASGPRRCSTPIATPCM